MDDTHTPSPSVPFARTRCMFISHHHFSRVTALRGGGGMHGMRQQVTRLGSLGGLHQICKPVLCSRNNTLASTPPSSLRRRRHHNSSLPPLLPAAVHPLPHEATLLLTCAPSYHTGNRAASRKEGAGVRKLAIGPSFLTHKSRS